MTTVISVRNWDEFQHYKDRKPKWIKLYRDTLTSESWVMGTDISRLVQVAIILLASRYDNEIPCRWELIRKVASLDCKEGQFEAALQHLLDSDFLKIQHVTSDETTLLQDASKALAGCYAQKRREEERREEDNNTMSAAPTAGDVEKIFNHWKTEFDHPKAVLTTKRRKLIRGRLKEYDQQDIINAISGYKNSPHHMGENDRHTVYDSIELFLRDAEHVDSGLRFFSQPPEDSEKKEQQRRDTQALAKVLGIDQKPEEPWPDFAARVQKANERRLARMA